MKALIGITFINQFGQEEGGFFSVLCYWWQELIQLPTRAGIDGGGVFKEFFASLCGEVFDTDQGLWLANKKIELYPHPHSYATERKSSFFPSFIQ